MRTCSWLVLLLLSVAAPAADYTFTGYARHVDTGALLYIETHAVSEGGTPGERRVVLYRRDENAAPFARKNLHYSLDRARPDFDFVCARSGFSESLARDGVKLKVSARAGAKANARSKLLADSDVRVVDAGFDEFVRANWLALERGDVMSAPFLVPSRLSSIDFKVRKVNEVNIDQAPAIVIRLSLGGAIGWFLPDIDVTYRKSDQRLLRYRGITNVRDAEGELLEAQIDFPDIDRVAGPVDLEKLRAQPLSSTRG
jgi:hypothetical protein